MKSYTEWKLAQLEDYGKEELLEYALVLLPIILRNRGGWTRPLDVQEGENVTFTDVRNTYKLSEYDVEDITQSTICEFLRYEPRILESIKEYREVETITLKMAMSYMVGIAKREQVKLFSRHKGKDTVSLDQTNHDGEFINGSKDSEKSFADALITELFWQEWKDNLSFEDSKIVDLILQGKTQKEIAQKIGLSDKSIRKHIADMATPVEELPVDYAPVTAVVTRIAGKTCITSKRKIERKARHS